MGFNRRATTDARNGRKGKVGRGGWKETEGLEKELKGSAQMSTLCSQLGPKHGQREQEGKGGEEVQEEKQKGQGEEEGDPRGRSGARQPAGAPSAPGARDPALQLSRLSRLHQQQLALQLDLSTGQPALLPVPCHRLAATQAQLRAQRE